MRDPLTPPTGDRKKIMFYDTLERQTKLRLRCEFDGITQSQFFRMMVTGYIENDGMIYSFLKSCKEKYMLQGQQKRNKLDKLQKEADKTKKMFALEDTEVESIFDIIELETGI